MTTSKEFHSETNQEMKIYSSPSLVDYGKMSELTQTKAGPGGDDTGDTPSSYSTTPS